MAKLDDLKVNVEVEVRTKRVMHVGGDSVPLPRSDTNPVSGHDVFRWPEFQAFARRLGLHLENYTKVVTVRIAEDEVVTIVEHYHGVDKGSEPTVENAADPAPVVVKMPGKNHWEQ